MQPGPPGPCSRSRPAHAAGPADALPDCGVVPARFRDEQRLAFGRVAKLYDRVRPSYPDAVIDAVLAFAGLRPGARILEIGAGTGKATMLLAERGLQVIALEPDHEMAAVARTNCAGYAGVEVVESDFERWPVNERFQAVVSAAAWHWVAPEVRYVQAGQALTDDGTLAAMWTFPDWERCPLRAPLSEAYRSSAPALAPSFPMHPDSHPALLAGDWPAETTASGRFKDPQTQTFAWTRQYSSAEYAMLVQTHQDHILLEPEQQAVLLATIVDAVDAHGGAIAFPLRSRLCLARRA